MAGFYAAYHGAEGLKTIATRILTYREVLKKGLIWLGIEVDDWKVLTQFDLKSFLTSKV